jgi:hypothetical protein
MAQVAATGIAKSFDKATVAAEQITREAAVFSGTDPVTMSAEAIAAAQSGTNPSVGGIEKPMVDMRVAKYTAIASMRVLETADQMTETLTSIVGRPSSKNH